MKIWLSHHHHALRQAMQRSAASPIINVLAVLSIAVSLSLAVGLALGLQSLHYQLSILPTQGSMTVYLHRNAGPDDEQQLKTRIHALPSLAEARFVSRDQALGTLSEHLGDPALARALHDNPLPDSWILMPKRLDSALIQQWHQQLAQQPAVSQIQDNLVWIQRLQTLYGLGTQLTFGIAAILALGIISLVGVTTRLQIIAYLPEIDVSLLIGATQGYVQRPFLYHGALQGGLAGLLAWLLISSVLYLLYPFATQLAQLYHSQLTLSFLPLSDVLLLCLSSALLGWLGAWLAMRITLRQYRPH